MTPASASALLKYSSIAFRANSSLSIDNTPLTEPGEGSF